jgi:large subunit ribosomal protein L25
MSDQIMLTVDARETVGKAVRQLRRDGIVPGVIHDHGKDSIYIQGDFRTLTKVYHQAGKHHPVQLTAGGKKYVTIIKDVTFDPKYNALTHIVFGAIKANEKVEAEIPVHAVYDEGNDVSPAERNSLIVLAQTTSVLVKALPNDLPDALTYNGEKLIAVGDQATVADLTIPNGVELEVEPEHVIATVFEPSALAAASDATAGDAELTDTQTVDSDVTPEDVNEEAGSKGETSPGGKAQKESHDQGTNPEKS